MRKGRKTQGTMGPVATAVPYQPRYTTGQIDLIQQLFWAASAGLFVLWSMLCQLPH